MPEKKEAFSYKTLRVFTVAVAVLPTCPDIMVEYNCRLSSVLSPLLLAYVEIWNAFLVLMLI